MTGKMQILLKKRFCLDQFGINNFIPQEFTQHSHEDGDFQKIKFRIPFSTMSTWNVIEPIIKIILHDKKYDLLLILSNNYDLGERIELCKQYGINYQFIDVYRNSYNVEEDKPDIFFLYQFSDTRDYGNLRENTKFIIAVCSHVNSEHYGREDFWNFLTNKSFGKYNPDFFIFDSLLYKMFTSGKPISNNIIEMGNPKFDSMYHAITHYTPIKGWEKLNDKIVLCYCPDHGLYDYSINKSMTFNIYGPLLFEWANRNKGSTALIFRPHPTMINELLHQKIWSKKDLNDFRSYVFESSNIVWDDHLSYNEAFSTCNAVLTDAFCGITCTALPIGKPVGALYRNENLNHIHKEVAEALYEIKDSSQLDDFLQMIQSGNDPLKGKREKISREILLNFDGENAQRIMSFIEEKYFATF